MAFKLAAIALTLFLVASCTALVFVALRGPSFEIELWYTPIGNVVAVVAFMLTSMALRSEWRGSSHMALACAFGPIVAYPFNLGFPIAAVLLYYSFLTWRESASTV